MKVYLCARYARKAELIAYRGQAHRLGMCVTSRWLLDGIERTDTQSAMMDVADVRAADVIVQFTDPPVQYSPHPNAARGGRHFEFGLAYATGLHCVVCGPRENIFHHLPGVIAVPTWPRTKSWLMDMTNMLEEAD